MRAVGRARYGLLFRAEKSAFVSRFLHIRGKLETNGNEPGNEPKTQVILLGKNGNKDLYTTETNSVTFRVFVSSIPIQHPHRQGNIRALFL